MKHTVRLLSALLLSSALSLGNASAQGDAGAGASAAAAAPAAAAAASSAASTSVASASSSAPPSATQTPASDTTSAAAAATGTAEASTSSTAPLTPNAGESSGDFLQRVMLAKSGLNADGTKADAAAGEEKPAGETPGEEKPAGEEKTEEKTETGDGTGEDDDEFSYDPYEATPAVIAPKDLSEKINANAALKAALDADPELRNTLYAQSRLAAETAEFKQVFSNADEAKIAAAGNVEFQALSELVTSIEKPQDAQGFYAKLMELSVIRDDDGNPILKDGKPVSDRTVGRLIHHTGALFLNHFEQVAETSNDAELTAAVEILKARAFGGPTSTSEDLTEEQKTRAQELDTRETALKTQEQAARAAKTAEYEDKIVSAIDQAADTDIGKLLGRTDIPQADHAAVTDKIRAAAYELVAANPQFQAEQDLLTRRTAGPKTQAERVGLGKKWLQVALPLVAPKIIAEQGAKILQRQKSRQATQTARQDAARSEAEGTLRAAKAAPSTSGKDVMALATDGLRQKLGREANTGEILNEVIRLRTAQ